MAQDDFISRITSTAGSQASQIIDFQSKSWIAAAALRAAEEKAVAEAQKALTLEKNKRAVVQDH